MHRKLMYNVWIHVEGVNRGGDIIEEYEPLKAADCVSKRKALRIQSELTGNASNKLWAVGPCYEPPELEIEAATPQEAALIALGLMEYFVEEIKK
jgi:hypothetical protein